MTKTPQATVAIVAYESGAFLQDCVNALAAQSFADFEAIIIDNGSADGSIAALKLPDERFRVVDAGGNTGFAAGNNRAAALARGEYFVTLNPDTRAERDWLAALIDAAVRWPQAASVGSMQMRMDNSGTLDGAGDVWHAGGLAWRALEGRPVEQHPPEGETFSACAAAALYRLADFRAVGGFDENFFCYCGDVDIGYRLRLIGRVAVQSPAAIVRHAGSGISGRRSDFTLFHGHRNRIWTFVKNSPAAIFWPMLPVHIAFNLYLLLRATMMPPGAGPMWRAYGAAFADLPRVWRTRAEVQRTRTATLADLTRAMMWAPWAISRRPALKIRPLPVQPVSAIDSR